MNPRLPRAAAHAGHRITVQPAIPPGNRTIISWHALLAATGAHRQTAHHGHAVPDCPVCTCYIAAVMLARADQTRQASP